MARRSQRGSAAGAGLALVALLVPAAAAEDPALSGRAIMERVDARPSGSDQKLRAVWRLIDRSGAERVRETRVFWRDLRGQGGPLRGQRLIVFTAPPTLEDTAFLVWDAGAVGEDDLRWIYLPAARKARRLAGRDRGSSFMGTDFLYEDLSEREVDDDAHRLLGEERECEALYYVIESRPVREGSPYSRRVLRVRAGDWIATRVEFYGRGGEHEKTLDVAWQRVQDLWTWKRRGGSWPSATSKPTKRRRSDSWSRADARSAGAGGAQTQRG